ncbi:hypothetical protein BpHYR1_029751 [Brachionus plicatilis]|uniref:Uncharacterized protein n=1 Tax=Brachionus plicatilis TaxID=10195 RepID=A0A3M7PFL2_BRAPC|nr:hypothetical protein BpHYR1_029751 [Brachionus plicatilis]
MFQLLKFTEHYTGGTKDVSAATIYRTCFGHSELKLWHFLHFVFGFCTKIHNAKKNIKIFFLLINNSFRFLNLYSIVEKLTFFQIDEKI